MLCVSRRGDGKRHSDDITACLCYISEDLLYDYTDRISVLRMIGLDRVGRVG